MKRKTLWIATDGGLVVGVFTSKKRAYAFCGEDVTLTKIMWNGFYHSEKPLDVVKKFFCTTPTPMVQSACTNQCSERRTK